MKVLQNLEGAKLSLGMIVEGLTFFWWTGIPLQQNALIQMLNSEEPNTNAAVADNFECCASRE